MANSPPSIHVLKYKGAGAVQVYPLLSTQLLGSQDGSDVGTGGPGVAALETAVPSGSFINSRVIEFLDDSYCVGANNASATSGVYKKNQGGAGLWGRVRGGGAEWIGFDGHTAGLHIVHPNEVPTLVQMWFDTASDLQVSFTTDGTTGAEWGTGLNVVEASVSQPTDVGQAIVFRDSIFWAHRSFSGTAGVGDVSQYDFQLTTLTRYASGTETTQPASTTAFHVHDNVLFRCGWTAGATKAWALSKLAAGSFVQLVSDSDVGGTDWNYVFASNTSHPVMFTDFTTGDLICFVEGWRKSDNTPRTRVLRIQDPTGAATKSVISSTVLGATEGADKYLSGGGSANANRRWLVFVDNDTVPTAPRTFLWTWIAGGATECWEWTGVGTEIEAVAGLAGISDDFSLPYVTRGGGVRNTGGAPRGELGDVSNPAVAVAAGTKWFFRVYGTGGPSIMTVYYSANEETPTTVATLAGSVVVESGAPATTPTRSGNTIINLTADDGATLYSFVHDTGADSLGVGVPHTLMPNVV